MFFLIQSVPEWQPKGTLVRGAVASRKSEKPLVAAAIGCSLIHASFLGNTKGWE